MTLQDALWNMQKQLEVAKKALEEARSRLDYNLADLDSGAHSPDSVTGYGRVMAANRETFICLNRALAQLRAEES